jgi:predicted DNA-binding transcriptional regulator AlpA
LGASKKLQVTLRTILTRAADEASASFQAKHETSLREIDMMTQASPVPTGRVSRERASLATRKATGLDRLLTPKEAAHFLRVSVSWLAKARMRGDGPPYILLGRSVRYRECDLTQYTNGRLRLSTSEGLPEKKKA